MGTSGARLGGELWGRIHPGRRGWIHCHRSENKEGACPRGTDHEGKLQGWRAWQACANYQQLGIQEEEAPLPIKGEEHQRLSPTIT